MKDSTNVSKSESSSDKNPCLDIGELAGLHIEREHCYCPGHGVYKAPHTRCIGGALTIIDGKTYRSGLCDKCWKEKYGS